MKPAIRIVILILALSGFCQCQQATRKTEFISGYHLVDLVPVDHSGKTTEQIGRPQDWFISLAEKNNFILERPGNKVYGYWEAIETESGTYAVILHTSGSSYPARIDRHAIYFDSPSGLLDSLFLMARFKRK